MSETKNEIRRIIAKIDEALLELKSVPRKHDSVGKHEEHLETLKEEFERLLSITEGVFEAIVIDSLYGELVVKTCQALHLSGYTMVTQVEGSVEAYKKTAVVTKCINDLLCRLIIESAR